MKRVTVIEMTAAMLTRKTTMRSARLETRMPEDLSERLKRAATLEGRNVSDYVISILDEATRETISRATQLQLSLRDADAFVDALLNPRDTVPGLKSAFEKRRDLLGKA